MNVLIFSGCLDKREMAISRKIATYLAYRLQEAGHATEVFYLADHDIPFFDFAVQEPPAIVREMCMQFRNAELHIWMTPLYHGSMTGAMKNCIDWLEITRNEAFPYLTNRVIALVCWADGIQAVQGINALDPVAKALRAWVLPFCVPVVKRELFDEARLISQEYRRRFDLLLQLLTAGSNTIQPCYSSILNQ